MLLRQLSTKMMPKVWGRDTLPAPFAAPPGERIGEIWFEPPPEFPHILVKYLFTSEKLSVQVHPSDEQAIPGESGKEECWLVLDAEPGACLAIGFERDVLAEEMAVAARDGTIEQLLTWHPVRAGDFFYLPAGTVHAIGPGLALVEVQQNSDTTFRLYDYGRPRELHLGRGLAVAQGMPYDKAHRSNIDERGAELVNSPYFRLVRIEGEPDATLLADWFGPCLVLPLQGCVSGPGGIVQLSAGECFYAERLAELNFEKAGVTLLVGASRK